MPNLRSTIIIITGIFILISFGESTSVAQSSNYNNHPNQLVKRAEEINFDTDCCSDWPVSVGPCVHCEQPISIKSPENVVGKLKITFDYSDYKIHSKYFDDLYRLSQKIKRLHNCIFVIEGHTDDDGDPKVNRCLSDKRAKSVYDFLVAMGISRRHLYLAGYGEDYPISSNDTREGMANNRRVVVCIKNCR